MTLDEAVRIVREEILPVARLRERWTEQGWVRDPKPNAALETVLAALEQAQHEAREAHGCAQALERQLEEMRSEYARMGDEWCDIAVEESAARTAWQADRAAVCEDRERLIAQLDAVLSEEACPKCGCGVTASCYGCALKAAEAKLAESEKIRADQAIKRGIAEAALAAEKEHVTALEADKQTAEYRLACERDRSERLKRMAAGLAAEGLRLRAALESAACLVAEGPEVMRSVDLRAGVEEVLLAALVPAKPEEKP